jgi:hypothetical protein
VFVDEAGEVRKRLRRSDCELACGVALDWRYKLLQAIREAERDLALLTFGNGWREHVGPMWGSPQAWEMRMIDQAAIELPSHFAQRVAVD